MLVLSRRVGERVTIGQGIVVVVKRIAGQRVTFGIEAPPDVRIVRGELKVYDTPRGEGGSRGSTDPIPMIVAPTLATDSMPVKPR